MITLNVNGSSNPVKRQRLSDWIKKNKQIKQNKIRPNYMPSTGDML